MSKRNTVGFVLMIIPIVIALIINEWKSGFDLLLIYKMGIGFDRFLFCGNLFYLQ